MAWLWLWTDILDSEKIADLDDSSFRGWVILLACAKRHESGGELPPLKKLAYWCRQKETIVRGWLSALEEAGFVEKNDGTYVMHDWDQWQARTPGRKSGGKALSNAERQRRFREARRNAASTVTAVTPPVPPIENNRIEESIDRIPLRNERNFVTDNVTSIPTPPTPPISSSEEDRVCRLAEEIGGDVSWAMWVSSRFKLGDTPTVIQAALSAAVDAGKVNLSYVGAIAKRYAKDGIPEVRSDGKRAVKENYKPVKVYPLIREGQ